LTKKLLGGAVIALILVGACTPAAAVVSPPPSVVAIPVEASASAATDPSAGSHEAQPWYFRPDSYAGRGDEIIGLRQTRTQKAQ
jgi:hypothetical protein